MGHCARRLGVIACLLVPTVSGAQLAPLGVPAGAVRFELDGALDSWDTRFLDGAKQGYGADLSSPAAGADLFPELAEAEARIARSAGLATYRINLGALATDAQADVGIGVFGLSLGLTKFITVFGRLPLVRSQVQTTTTLDPTAANVGANPGEELQAGFFTEFDAALVTLSSRLSSGVYDGNPAQRALAEATLAEATTVRDDLLGLLGDPLTASPFLPTAASEAGVALSTRLDDIRTTLDADLGVPGFTASPALPAETLTTAELINLIADPLGPLALRPENSLVTFRGDAEAGVALTLVDRWDRGARPGGLRAAVEGLVRFPTGERKAADRPLALGTGEGQTDVEFRVVTDLGSGSWGARFEGGYNRQLAADIVERVAPPSQPFARIDLLANVRRDPGDVVSLAARPFFRLAPSVAIQGSVEHWSRGEDDVRYANEADAIPGVDASVLAAQSKASATVVGIGITYANLGGLRPGGRGLPVEAGWAYERVISASGGRVPNVHRLRGRFRVYFDLF